MAYNTLKMCHREPRRTVQPTLLIVALDIRDSILDRVTVNFGTPSYDD
jgi:hypothetical protein